MYMNAIYTHVEMHDICVQGLGFISERGRLRRRGGHRLCKALSPSKVSVQQLLPKVVLSDVMLLQHEGM